MPSVTPPLSSTVSTVFAEFTKKLEDEKILNEAALKALRLCLEQQKLDHESLRKALFTINETPE
jgi:hypothetical protein